MPVDTLTSTRGGSVGVLRRLGGFAALPFIGSVAPLLVLPVVSRVAGPGGWASIGVGTALGNLAAVLIMFGWWGLGPARYASLDREDERRDLYRESLATRIVVALVVLPALVGACWALSSPGWAAECVVMGLAIALGGFSPNWYFVAAGRPWALARYESIPRSVVSVVSIVPLLLTGQVWTYPALLLLVTLWTAVAASVDVAGRRPVRAREVLASGRSLRGLVPIAASSTVGSLYSATPLPIASAAAPVGAVAGFASGDRLYRYALYAVIALGNALQSWTLDRSAGPGGRRHRQRRALLAHVTLGAVGGAGLAALGVPVSRLLFGDAVAVDPLTAAAFGLAFFCTSASTPLIRTVLIPAGRTALVLRATVTGTVVGVPLMLVGVRTMGVGGAAVGLAASEAAVLLMAAAAARTVRKRSEEVEVQ